MGHPPPLEKGGKKKPTNTDDVNSKKDDGFPANHNQANVIVGGHYGTDCSHCRKLTEHEILSIKLVVLTPLKWSDMPISFYKSDQWNNFSNPGRYPLVLDLIMPRSCITKTLSDGGSGLNVIFTNSLRMMGLNISKALEPADSPFYDIVPGNATVPLGKTTLPSCSVRVRIS